jgi:hypothetical protein
MIRTDLITILLSNTADLSGGAICWTNPEVLDTTRFGLGGPPRRESDCYALGMAVYEVNHFSRPGAFSLTHLQVLSDLSPLIHLRSLTVLCAIITGTGPGVPPKASSLGFTDTLWGCYSRVGACQPWRDLLPGSCLTIVTRPPRLGFHPDSMSPHRGQGYWYFRYPQFRSFCSFENVPLMSGMSGTVAGSPVEGLPPLSMWDYSLNVPSPVAPVVPLVLYGLLTVSPLRKYVTFPING